MNNSQLEAWCRGRSKSIFELCNSTERKQGVVTTALSSHLRDAYTMGVDSRPSDRPDRMNESELEDWSRDMANQIWEAHFDPMNCEGARMILVYHLSAAHKKGLDGDEV